MRNFFYFCAKFQKTNNIMKKVLLGALVLVAALVMTGCGNHQNQKNNKVKTNNLLIIVDPQIDFTTGSLAVAGGPEAMDRLSQALENGLYKKYDKIVVTQDFHPANHCSFVEQGGVFPPHCVQNTEGVNVYPNLQKVLDKIKKEVNIEYLTKGDQAGKEEFSIFQNEKNGEYLNLQIKETQYNNIDICGIASDYCVLETLKDLLYFFPAGRVRVATNCIASVADDEILPAFMKEKGVQEVSF